MSGFFSGSMVSGEITPRHIGQTSVTSGRRVYFESVAGKTRIVGRLYEKKSDKIIIIVHSSGIIRKPCHQNCRCTECPKIERLGLSVVTGTGKCLVCGHMLTKKSGDIVGEHVRPQ